jgi:addiction module HigA family antidote
MGMSRNRLNEVLAKKRGVTPETAVLFGALTETDPRVWLHLQADYDLWHAMKTTDATKVEPLTAAGSRSRS